MAEGLRRSAAPGYVDKRVGGRAEAQRIVFVYHCLPTCGLGWALQLVLVAEAYPERRLLVAAAVAAAVVLAVPREVVVHGPFHLQLWGPLKNGRCPVGGPSQWLVIRATVVKQSRD